MRASCTIAAFAFRSVQGFIRDGRKGYEELPICCCSVALGDFKALLAQGRTLPTNFTAMSS
ncbi:MAG: hypothetical protein ACLRVN_05520 [Butyricicoccus sp.]